MDDFKQKTDELKQFVEDCKVYRRAMDRMKTLGIHDEQKAIVYLQREIDQYRDKIRSMEESIRFNEDVKKNTHTANLLERMSKEMVDRITSIYIDSDGNMSATFDTSAEQSRGRMRRMIAYKCDRCGKYYEEYKKDLYDLPERFIDDGLKRKGDYVDGIIICSNKNGQCDGMSKHIDLCPECMEELMAFLDGKYKHAITMKCDGKSIEECVRRLKNDR